MLLDVGEVYVLKCPGCGESNMHHSRVEVFDRAENEKFGTHIVVNRLTEYSKTNTPVSGYSMINSDMRGNPSSRRHGLNIFLYCEDCNLVSKLSIAQHKGSTLLSIEKTARQKAYERSE